jgi:chemotaxis protein CheC
VGGRSVIRLREEILALVALQEALGLGDVTTDNNSRRPVVVVDYEEKKIGLAVDRVLGNREIVIKSLSRHYREIEGLIGASILGDGRIALIVDVEALVRLYYRGNDETAEAASTGSVSLQLDDRPIDAAPAELSYTARAPATEPPPSEPPDSPSSSPASTRPQPGLEARPDCGPEALAAQLRLLSGRAIADFHNEGAIQASIAVSRMSGQEIRVSFPESQLVGLGSLAGQLGGEELAVCGIYVGLTGELAGSILMVLPDVNLLRFHELFYRLPAGSCQSLAEVDLSAMSELGNVLSASFINALADGTHLQIRSEAPEIVMDMCQSVIDTVLARFNRPGEQIVLTKALLYLDDSQQVVCNLLLFLEPESLTRLLALLDGEQT